MTEWPLSAEEVEGWVEAGKREPPPAVQQRQLNVWEIHSTEGLNLLPRELHGVFRSDSCYMVLDTHLNAVTGRKQHVLYFWMGEHADRMFFLEWRFQLSGRCPRLRTGCGIYFDADFLFPHCPLPIAGCPLLVADCELPMRMPIVECSITELSIGDCDIAGC